MGLVYWAPMTDGTVKNQGIITTQAPATEDSHYTFSTDGKLGKCIKTNSSSSIDTFLIGDWVGEKSNTLAGWFYFPYNEIKAVVDANTSTNTVPTGTLFGYCSYAGIGLSWYSNKPMTTFWVMIAIRTGSSLYTAGYQLTAHDLMDKWVHLAGIWDDDNLKIRFFVNGEQVTQVNITSQEPVKQHLFINRNAIYGGNGPACCIPFYCNDLRVYKDEILSDRDIKHLAQGLTLHYPLSDSYQEGTTNLVTSEYGITKTCYNGATSKYGYGANTDMYRVIGDFEGKHCTKVYMGTNGLSAWPYVYFNNQTNVGETKTLSFDYFPSVFDKVNFYNLSTNVALKYSVNGITGTANNSVTLTVNVGKWNHIVLTGENVGENNGGMGYMRINNGAHTSSTDNYWLFANVQVELKDHATGYIPYGTTRADKNTILDASGHQYNGTVNNIVFDSYETVINRGFYIFNGTDSWVRCDTNAWMVQGATEFTVNWWAYASDWTAVTNGGRMVSCTESGGFNTEGGATGYLRFPHYVFTNEAKTSRAYQYNNNGIKLADLTPGWHMFTLIYNLAGEKIYIDGTLHSSANSTSYGISFNTNARLYLGCEANSASPYTPYFNGKMSDFRFYYTELDENAIKELYMMGGGVV